MLNNKIKVDRLYLKGVGHNLVLVHCNLFRSVVGLRKTRKFINITLKLNHSKIILRDSCIELICKHVFYNI